MRDTRSGLLAGSTHSVELSEKRNWNRGRRLRGRVPRELGQVLGTTCAPKLWSLPCRRSFNLRTSHCQSPFIFPFFLPTATQIALHFFCAVVSLLTPKKKPGLPPPLLYPATGRRARCRSRLYRYLRRLHPSHHHHPRHCYHRLKK